MAITFTEKHLEELRENYSAFHATFFSERADLHQQHEALLALWTLVSSRLTFLQDDSCLQQCGNLIVEIFRATQMHFVSPKFAESTSRDDLIHMVEMPSEMFSSLSLHTEFAYTIKLFAHPWMGNPIMDILRRDVSFPTQEYFANESFSLCWRRLQVLQDNGAPDLMVNYLSFLVSAVFGLVPGREDPVLQKWVQDATESSNSVYVIVEMLLVLMLQQKEDQHGIVNALGGIGVPELCQVAMRLRQRLDKAGSRKSLVVGLVTTEEAPNAFLILIRHIFSRASQTNCKSLLESWMVAACWELAFGNVDDKEVVERQLTELVSAKIQTDMAHAVLYRYAKTSHDQEEFDDRMDQWVKLFSHQLDSLNFAHARQNEEVVQNIEVSLSRGFILLTLLFEANKDFCHECLLTSISLNPQKPIGARLLDILKQRGLLDESFKIDRPAVKKPLATMNFETSEFENLVESFIQSLLKIQNRRSKQKPFSVKSMISLIEACRWGILDSDQTWDTLFSEMNQLFHDPRIRRPIFAPITIDYNKIADKNEGPIATVYGQVEPGYEYVGREVVEESEKVVEKGLTDVDLSDIPFNVKVPVQDHGLDLVDYSIEEVTDTNLYLPRSMVKQRSSSSLSRPRKEKPTDNHGSGFIRSDLIVGYCFVTSPHSITAVKNDLSTLHPNSWEVRRILTTFVPGLENASWQVPNLTLEYQVGVVHVTIGESSSPQPSTSTATSNAPIIAQNTPVVLSNRKVDVTSADSTASGTPKKEERETKIQYVYKHGSQTIVVDRQLTEEELSKLKFPSPNARLGTTSNGLPNINTVTGINQTQIAPQVQQPQRLQVQLPSPQLLKDKVPAIILARPAVPQQATLPRMIIPAQASSVDTLANTLISRIQTPVQLTPDGQPLSSDEKSSSSTGPPKFQFSFGRDTHPSKPDNPELNGRKLILSPVQTTQVTLAQPANIVQAKLGTGQQSTHVVLPLSTNGLSPLQRAILPAQLTLQNSAGPSTSSSSDLIRQLNVARAQGLVVLQQWGDKQVLVHKATGRWIMRQGNKLVTVPPQILGISEAGAVTASPTPSSSIQSSSSITMSTSTMEQIREFDSILESKFKSTPPPSDEMKPGTTLNCQQQQTFVILAPQGNVGSTTSIDFQQVKSFASLSAPTSPSKVIKIPVSSISASASPISGAAGISSPFAKPPPKPQEDNDTLKRIQQILDDYNEQIRNAPDLQNRPAPRRRTNGPTVINPADSTKRSKRSSSVSPPPAASGSDSDVGSPSVVQISTPTMVEGQVSVSNGDGLSTTESSSNYSVLRQIVVPSSLAAQFQASGRQIMVVTGAGGKKMVAFKPVFVSSSPSNNVNKVISVSAGGPSISMPTRILPTLLSTGSSQESHTFSVMKTDTPINIRSSSVMPIAHSVGLRTTAASVPLTVPTSSTTGFLANSSSSITLSTSSTNSQQSPSPPLGMMQVGLDDRTLSPGLGLSMEMTTEQLLDADLAASAFLDSNPESPFAMLSNSPTSSMIRQQDEDDLLNEALQENLFALDLPSSLLDEDCGDLDLVNPHFGKRQRNLSTSSSEDVTPVSKRAKFIKVNSMDPNLMDSSQGVLRF